MKKVLWVCLTVLLLSCGHVPDIREDGGIRITVELDNTGLSARAFEDAKEQCIAIYKERILKAFGIEANVTADPKNPGRLVIEIPGLADETRVTRLLSVFAELSFHSTYESGEIMPSLISLDTQLGLHAAEADTSLLLSDLALSEENHPLFSLLQVNQDPHGSLIALANAGDTAKINALLNGSTGREYLPHDLHFVWSAKPEQTSHRFELIALRIEQDRSKQLNGQYIAEAKSVPDTQTGRQLVEITLNKEGASLWAALTASNLKRSVAIVLNDKVYSYPRVMEAIHGGVVWISGNFTTEEAHDLANLLDMSRMPLYGIIVSTERVKPAGK